MISQFTDDYVKKDSQDTITGILTGFTELDDMLSGLQPKHLILIGARPGMGKTSLALSIAHYNAFCKNIMTAIFNLELPKEKIVSRLNAMECGVKKELSKAVLYNEKSHLIIDGTIQPVQNIYSKCKKYKLEHDLGLVIVDYLQLLGGTVRKNDFGEEMLNITCCLKQLAKELNIPIIVLSQLDRDGSLHLDDKYIDNIIFIHRHDWENTEDAELIIEKQNNGRTGTIHLKWSRQFVKFIEL